MEECIPTVKGYEYERINASKTKKVIQVITKQRESSNSHLKFFIHKLF